MVFDLFVHLATEFWINLVLMRMKTLALPRLHIEKVFQVLGE